MRRAGIVLSAAIALAAAGGAAGGPGAPRGELRPAGELAAIADRSERSRAAFTEAAKVLLHPRCVNCHPAGDSPLVGEDGRLHEPPVRRGLGGTGAVGMRCRACHMRENFDPGRVPGAHQWVLAPRKMAWQGLTLAELCEQIKDPERNGGRTLDEIVEHMAEDELVAWGWAPGAGREPVPGSQAGLAELIAVWAESGAVCPEPAER